MARRGEARSIAAVHALHLAEVVLRWGVTQGQLLEGIAHEASLHDPSAQLSVAVVEALLARARTLTGEPGIGFYLGLQMRVSGHGYLGFAAMVASTVREALALASRFVPTRTSALSLRIEEEGGLASLVIHELADFGTAQDAVLIALSMGLWQMGNALTGRTLTGRAEFAFAAPAYVPRFASRVPEVRFGCPQHRLIFDAAVLDLPLIQADPVALQLARAQCERELDALGPERLVARVRAFLSTDERGFRSLPEVAAALAVSPRTLKRSLAALGTTFSTLLEEQRRDRALRLLRAPACSIAEVAERLGYSDVANFGRAFRRWTDTSPAEWRRRARGSGEPG